jgi:hypothetical protein
MTRKAVAAAEHTLMRSGSDTRAPDTDRVSWVRCDLVQYPPRGTRVRTAHLLVARPDGV